MFYTMHILINLLSSRLYCRYWNYTSSTFRLADYYRRSGISPCPEGTIL